MPDIALVNEAGHSIASKPRSALEPDDVYHSVLVLLVTTTKQMILSVVGSKYGATAMTICAADETAHLAAARVAPGKTLHHLGDHLHTLAGGRKTYMSVFYAVGTAPTVQANVWQALPRSHIEQQLTDGSLQFTDAMATAWGQYKHLLPL